VKFEDVSLTFTEEEWAQLDFQQKCLYREIMMENYSNMISVGKAASTLIKSCLGGWSMLLIPAPQRWRRIGSSVPGLTLPAPTPILDVRYP
jgi:hypothetical protein